MTRWLDRLRPHALDEETRRAIRRTEEIRKHVERQDPEARRLSAYAIKRMADNELAPEILAALRGK